MEFLLFLLFTVSCFFLFVSLVILPRIKSLEKQLKHTYEVIPPNTPLSQIAPEIGYVLPGITPFPVPEKRFRYRGKVYRFPMCPKCGKSLVQRTGKFGDFFGCTGYPNCHFTKKVS